MRAHWPEYVIEAAGLGAFMLSACVLGTLLGHPASPVVHVVPDPLVRRMLMGVAMGLTAVSLIYSPWGRRSGAHFNPATTLTFWRLGKVTGADAVAYALAQAIGGLTGVAVAALVVGPALGHPAVRYVATVPGRAGLVVALAAEVAITFVLMTVVLEVSNTASLARFTGLTAGGLVAVYITVEAPLSGMSMNPARSLASAVPAGAWDALWIYVVAPPVGMLLAAEVYARRGANTVYCAKLNHGRAGRCIFRCRHAELLGR
ncbi:MAG TPA: aquaporin [Methylomirabilota bacterium]|jgi:aquaporin Z